MFIAAIWHSRDACFGYADFQPATLGERRAQKTAVLESLRDAFNPGPWLADLGRGLKHFFERLMGRTKTLIVHDVPLLQGSADLRNS